MKKIVRLITLTIFLGSAQLFAWGGSLHDTIGQRALIYLGESSDAKMQRAYNVYVGSAGSEAQAADWLGFYAKDADNNEDLNIGGWWVAGCRFGSPTFFGLFDSSEYTKLMHAVSINRWGQGYETSRYPGYRYRWATATRSQGVTGKDKLLGTALWNQAVCSTGKATMSEFYFGGGNRSANDLGDYQDAEFTPLSNMVRGHFNRMKAYATFGNIGNMCHGADAVVIGHNMSFWEDPHQPYEGHCKDRYNTLGLGSKSKIDAVVNNYSTSTNAGTIIERAAEEAYYGGTLNTLSSNSTTVWDNACKVSVPNAIAACATLYTKAINCLYGEDCNN